MKRRRFIGSAVAAGLGASLSGASSDSVLSGQKARGSKTGFDKKRLGRLLADCRKQLFDRYLPFWERGGYDDELGGFMCYLYDDGAVENDRKDIWYQGRGIWVYSYLYNDLDS